VWNNNIIKGFNNNPKRTNPMMTTKSISINVDIGTMGTCKLLVLNITKKVLRVAQLLI
jgi:hypothetical protein